MRLAPEIVAAMQQLALEQRRLLGPRAPWHVGDVAWGLRQHEGRENEWKIRLWVEDGRVVAPDSRHASSLSLMRSFGPTSATSSTNASGTLLAASRCSPPRKRSWISRASAS